MENESKWLKEQRLRLRLTQGEFADKLQLKQGSLSDIERGRIGISRKLLKKLKEVFKIELSNDENPTETTWNYCPHCGKSLK